MILKSILVSNRIAKKDFYSIDKYQLILLWIFSVAFAYFSYKGSLVERACLGRLLHGPCFDFRPSFSDLLGLLGFPFLVVFYTIGWRKSRGTKSKDK